MEASLKINTYLSFAVILGCLSNQGIHAQSHRAAQDQASLGIKEESPTRRAEVEFDSGHSIMEHKNGLVLKNSKGNVLTFGKNLDLLLTNIQNLDEKILSTKDKMSLATTISKDPLIKNYLDNSCVSSQHLRHSPLFGS